MADNYAMELEMWLESKHLVDVVFPADEVTMGNLKALLLEDIKEEYENTVRDFVEGKSAEYFREHTQVLYYLQQVMEQLEQGQKPSAVAPILLHIRVVQPFKADIETREIDHWLMNGMEIGTKEFEATVEEYIRAQHESNYWQDQWRWSEEPLSYAWSLIEAGSDEEHLVDVMLEDPKAEHTVPELIHDYGLWVGHCVTYKDKFPEATITDSEHLNPMDYLIQFADVAYLPKRDICFAFLSQWYSEADEVNFFLDKNFSWD